MNYLNLVTRCRLFVDKSGVPITRMCKRIGMATSTYYRWINGGICISEKKAKAIENYLKGFGY